ncbi:MAG: tetratricopeptide repeat protein [Verrucomicrobia bacterium]|nr:tetratricopeptide repeat protein [Verrucomicrobiota bacterium]
MAAASPLDREIVFTPHAGPAPEDVEIRRWQTRAAAPTATADDLARLGWAYVAKARRTLDAGFHALAEKTAAVMDERFGARAESGLLRGHVLHNLHRFREAETVARGLVATRGRPEDLALLNDALMEQGKLAEAIEVLQRLLDQRPGVEAYSRVAQMRWLKGDLPGAIAAMEQALRAAPVREAETVAWVLVRLSGFHLQAGRLEAAREAADAAAGRLEDFPPALLARGRVLLAFGQTEGAAAVLQRAAELNPLPEYQWWLADTLRGLGREADAAKVERALRTRGAVADSRTFALFLAANGEGARAVGLARAELAIRADVFTHDALAWALAANGEFAAAGQEMRAALAERTPDARLLWHAGEIALRCGAPEEAADYFRRAQPFAATLMPAERRRLAARLEAPDPAAPGLLFTQNQKSHP